MHKTAHSPTSKYLLGNCFLLLSDSSCLLREQLAQMGRSKCKGRPGRSKKRKFYGKLNFRRPAPAAERDLAERNSQPSLSGDNENSQPSCDDDFDNDVGSDIGDSHDSDEDSVSDEETEGNLLDSDSDEEWDTGACGFRLIDLGCLQNLFSAVSCKSCHGPVSITEVQRHGLASCLEVTCSSCDERKPEFMSRKISRFWEVNRRAVLGMRLIGKSRQALVKLAGALDMPSPMTRSAYHRHEQALHDASRTVAETSMSLAAREARSGADIASIPATYDGTWMRCGYASLYGVFTAIAWDVGKVVDCEVLSKFYHKCSFLSGQKRNGKITAEEYEEKMAAHQWARNTTVSSAAMESEAAKTIWARSVEQFKLRYTTFIGDGDTKSFKVVSESAPYGPDIPVSKEECVGHVQKRMGSNLRKLRKECAGSKLADGRHNTSFVHLVGTVGVNGSKSRLEARSTSTTTSCQKQFGKK